MNVVVDVKEAKHLMVRDDGKSDGFERIILLSIREWSS